MYVVIKHDDGVLNVASRKLGALIINDQESNSNENFFVVDVLYAGYDKTFYKLKFSDFTEGRKALIKMLDNCTRNPIKEPITKTKK